MIDGDRGEIPTPQGELVAGLRAILDPSQFGVHDGSKHVQDLTAPGDVAIEVSGYGPGVPRDTSDDFPDWQIKVFGDEHFPDGLQVLVRGSHVLAPWRHSEVGVPDLEVSRLSTLLRKSKANGAAYALNPNLSRRRHNDGQTFLQQHDLRSRRDETLKSWEQQGQG